MASQAARPRSGADADLPDMAAQLLAMLIGLGDGERGRKAWDQLQGMLATGATYLADPAITVEHMLSFLEEGRGPSSLPLGHPEAEALLRRIMASLEKETIRALDAGVAILRLRELLLVVAGQLDMLPLRDSPPVHIVDGDANFCDANVATIIQCSPQLSAPNAPYGVVSIVGAQSSGKSYLLNRLFGTNFPEMNAKRGRSQTTRGIMMSRCIGPSLLVLDVEGFDGREKGQDTLFEKQAALFALTVSDVMLVNISVQDIGREMAGGTELFKTIFKERTKLPVGLTNVLVVLRLYDGETPLHILKADIMKSLEKMWKSVNNKSRFEDYIKVNVVGLPDKSASDFPNKVTILRRHLSNNTVINRNGSAKVPASSFSVSSRRFWDKIKNNEKLDILSHQEALAILFCQQTADNALKSVDSHEDYKLLKIEESPKRFRDISDTLLGSIVTMYDTETEKYDPKVRDNGRQYMVDKLMKVFNEDSRELIRKMMGNTCQRFEVEYARNLKNMEETDIEIKYDDKMVDSCMEEFMQSCEDLMVFDSGYLHMKCAEIKKHIHLYINHQILTLKEIRGRRATLLAQQRSDKNLEEVLKRLEEIVKEKQHAETEIRRLKEKHLMDELEYSRKLLAEQQQLALKIFADKRYEAEVEKMRAVQKEQTDKLYAAQAAVGTSLLVLSSLAPLAPLLMPTLCSLM